jgi:CBS-domain-containing membrane protein
VVRALFVHEVMTREPTTVSADTTLKRTAEILTRRQISALPVLDVQQRICGVVSEADLIRHTFAPDPRAHLRHGPQTARSRARVVRDVMTSHAITVHESTDLAELADLMTSYNLKSVPVIDDEGRLVGVVSRSDLVRVRARADQQIERDVDSMLVYMGHRDWLVEVSDGSVEINGPTTDLERSIAEISAGTVAGVVAVKVR